MIFIRSFIVAFSLYSKIPMPRFTWNGKDMKYHLCFFPLVGLLIAGLEYGWWILSGKIMAAEILVKIIAVLIPVFVTGGFHLDGFMDTMDAIHSYQDREKKLEILKDPHIGAFSVICLFVYFLLCLGFSHQVNDRFSLISVCFSFVLSRILSGLSVMIFPKAKKDGMASVESKSDKKSFVVASLIIQLVVCCVLLVFMTLEKVWYSCTTIAISAIAFLHYYLMSKKNFGGITGDLAGYFVCICELLSLVGVGILSCVEALS